MSYHQARWFMLTEPYTEDEWPIEIDDLVDYSVGQLEIGKETGHLHWQYVLHTKKKITRQGLLKHLDKKCWCEPSRSDAATKYSNKSETSVEGTQWEIGVKPFALNSKPDWDTIWELAKLGKKEEIPSGIRFRSYTTINRIAEDYGKPCFRGSNTATVFIGGTGVGKTRRAWEEAGAEAYIKDSRTKWWDGYRGEDKVIIDEFAGYIELTRLLSWLDIYPCRVEKKGGSMPLLATQWWITSNLSIDDWYRDGNPSHIQALKRRVKVIEMYTIPVDPPGALRAPAVKDTHQV